MVPLDSLLDDNSGWPFQQAKPTGKVFAVDYWVCQFRSKVAVMTMDALGCYLSRTRQPSWH